MPELQDIFREYGEAYRQNYRLPVPILRTMKAIERCRTSELGCHSQVCDDCGHVQVSYNSCRNRHCPKCQTLTKERWISGQKHNLLNIGYFHVVFTIPDTLNTLVFQNQRTLYTILFKAAAETLQELATNPKYLGARIGITEILHTWGQNLMHHPHIHCIVPGGGIDSLGNWRSSRKKFFVPVKVLSRKFRGKFLHYLKSASLDFHGALRYLSNPGDWSRFLSSLYQKEWIVFCKPPFKNAACVVEYLGRYTHRVAISNNRILKAENGMVIFKWRDYKDSSKWKVMALPADEFIRRFLIHILPPGFMKIRHYGLLANRGKAVRLNLCKLLTHTPLTKRVTPTTVELIFKLTGKDISICPRCGSSKLSRYPYALENSS